MSSMTRKEREKEEWKQLRRNLEGAGSYMAVKLKGGKQQKVMPVRGLLEQDYLESRGGY